MIFKKVELNNRNSQICQNHLQVGRTCKKYIVHVTVKETSFIFATESRVHYTIELPL